MRLLAILLMVFALACSRPPRRAILISIDTLRADALSCYGYHFPTPNIDAVATDSVLFGRAYANGCWTMPSHISMLTGTLPARHGVNMAWFNNRPDNYRTLNEDIKTLAELIPAKSVIFARLPAELGFSRGFHTHSARDPFRTDDDYDNLIGLFDQFADGDFFFFVHTWMVHAPYSDAVYFTDDPQVRDYVYHLRETSTTAETELREFLEQRGEFNAPNCRKLYNGGISRVDQGIGRLMDDLKERNLYDHTLIIITSDHGEHFQDHYLGFYGDHGSDYYDEYVRVPLIVKHPRSRFRGIVRDTVSLIDIAPTILDFFAVPIPESVQGEILPRPGQRSNRTVISEATTKVRGKERKMILKDGIKLIVEMSDISGPARMGKIESHRVYDLEADPREDINIGGHEDLLVELVEAIHKSKAPPGKQTAISEETREQLRALGYME